MKEIASNLYYEICNTCVEFDENEMPFISINDENKDKVAILLGGLQDFLVAIMFNRIKK